MLAPCPGTVGGMLAHCPGTVGGMLAPCPALQIILDLCVPEKELAKTCSQI
jgi:hypothetical protein